MYTIKVFKSFKTIKSISSTASNVKYNKIHTYLIKPIILNRFLREKYLFIFTNGVMQKAKTHIEKKKSM